MNCAERVCLDAAFGLSNKKDWQEEKGISFEQESVVTKSDVH